MQNISGVLYQYLQSVQAYIAPPIAAVFLLGIFHKRINSSGALSTLVVGLIIAFVRIGLELVGDSLDPDGIVYVFAKSNFLTFAAWFFLFSVIFCVAVSLATPPPSPQQVQGLTYSTMTEEQKQQNKNSYNIWDVLLSLAVIGIVAYVMVSFAG